MKRILLILEDFNEQSFIETLFKKIGFDVLTLRSEITLLDNLLSFKPDVTIATGDGLKIKGARVSKKIRERGFQCHTLLLFPAAKIQDQSVMAAFHGEICMQTPVDPRKLIAMICDLTGLSADMVFQKYEKLPIAKTGKAGMSKDSLRVVSSKEAERKAKYLEILKSSPNYKDIGFPKDVVEKVQEEMREYEKNNPSVKDIDKQRQEYVVALFKKNK